VGQKKLHGIKLPPRELQILQLTVIGLTDSEIATALGISRNTVRSHIAHLKVRLGVNSRLQLGIITAHITGVDQTNDAA